VICVVDYGLGNVQAILNIYEHVGVDACAAATGAELRTGDRLILPGVGSFDWAMTRLNQSGMREDLNAMVLEERVPILGICVGMQMMMEWSEEGDLEGLGWVEGGVKRLGRAGPRGRRLLPHMGWNDVAPLAGADLFEGYGADLRFYFLHSFVVDPMERSHIHAQTDYGETFAASIRKDNIRGVQFHPEKSHDWGVQLLENFSRTTGC